MIDWDKVKELHDNGYSNRQIRNILNISRGSVQRIIKNIKNGKSRDATSNPKQICDRLNISEDKYKDLLRTYYEDGLSQREIAKKLNVHITTIENQFKKYKIQSRSISDATKWQQKNCTLSTTQLEILDGILLGDGHLDSSNVSARITYGCKFVETLNDISNEFSQLHFSKPWCSKISNRSWRTKNRYWHFKSSYYNDLLYHRHRWYKAVKIIPDDIHLTNKSLYWWFIGDGYINKKCVIMCTDGFDYLDLVKLKNKLHTIGYIASITTNKRLRFDRASSLKLINNIKENNVVHTQYNYKFEKDLE